MHFSPFTFLRFFWGEKDKKLFWKNFLKFWLLFQWLGFSIWNSGLGLFWHKSPVFFWVICWHFLPFKGLFVTIFTFLGFFGMKMEKNFSCNGECFKIFIFIYVIWVILSGIMRGCFFDTIDPFSFVWFVDIFYPLRVNCLKLSPSWDFGLVKMDKKLLL